MEESGGGDRWPSTSVCRGHGMVIFLHTCIAGERWTVSKMAGLSFVYGDIGLE